MAVKKKGENAPRSKKTIRKRTVAKKKPLRSKKKILVLAGGEVCFWIHDGGVLQSLLDLEDALKWMTEAQYEYHTARSGNDFAKWVAVVLGDAACAEDLAKAKDKKEELKAVEKHLKNYDI